MKFNIFSNYFSQFFAAIVSILAIPYYVKILGGESYGLIGFYGLVLILFQLLDVGLSPTLSREVALFRGGVKSSVQIWQLFNWVLLFFVVTSFLGMTLVFFSSNKIATSWLKVEFLSLSDTELAVKIIGLIVSIKWASGLFKSLLLGFEKIIYLSIVNVVVTTIASILVIPILLDINNSIITYFIVQLIASIIEFCFLLVKSLRVMPQRIYGTKESIKDLSVILKFALGVAFTSSIWILITQVDKLLLSKYLSLSEYGFFTLGVMAASGVNMIGGPIRQSILPRITKLYSENKTEMFLSTYRNGTQLVSVLAFSFCFTLFFFSFDILMLWLNDKVIALNAKIILQLYSISNGLIAVSTMPSLLQFAKGKLKLHVFGNAIFAIMYLPTLFLCISNYGAKGAAMAWFVSNVIYFAIWIPITNSKIQPGINKSWLLQDVFMTIFPSFIISVVFKIFRDQFVLSSFEVVLVIGLSIALSLTVSSLSSSFLRKLIFDKLSIFSSKNHLD